MGQAKNVWTFSVTLVRKNGQTLGPTASLMSFRFPIAFTLQAADYVLGDGSQRMASTVWSIFLQNVVLKFKSCSCNLFIKTVY